MLKRLELIALFIGCGLALFAVPRPAYAATCTGGGGVWTNPAIWNCGSGPVVPAPADDVIVTGFQVIIPSGLTVERIGATTIGNLSLDGTLINYGTLTKNGPFSSNSGSIIYNFGTMIFNTAMSNGGTIINCGTITGVQPGGTVLNGPCDEDSLPFKVKVRCINDGRLNSICDHQAASAVLYCQPNGDLHVYRIDSEGEGHYSFTVTQQQIEDAGVPTENPGATLIAASSDGAIRLYRLSDEQFQLNAPAVDQVHGYIINGYVFRWNDPCPQPT